MKARWPKKGEREETGETECFVDTGKECRQGKWSEWAVRMLRSEKKKRNALFWCDFMGNRTPGDLTYNWDVHPQPMFSQWKDRGGEVREERTKDGGEVCGAFKGTCRKGGLRGETIQEKGGGGSIL